MTQCSPALKFVISTMSLLYHRFKKSFPIEHHGDVCPPGLFALHIYMANSVSAKFAIEFHLRESLIVAPSEVQNALQGSPCATILTKVGMQKYLLEHAPWGRNTDVYPIMLSLIHI